MKHRVLCVAALLVVIASSLATADVVALKRSAGLTDARGFDASLASAISGGAATVYSGQGVIADSGGLYSDQGWAQSQIYANFGASAQSQQGWPFLVKFGLNALPGFTGSTVAKAELRFYTPGGNSGWMNAGYITTSDWVEGPSDGGYPGAAGGVSGAHPIGFNTGPYQTADGTGVDVGYPPNMSLAPFSWANNQPFAPSKDAVTLVSGGLAHNPWDVGPIQWDQYITVDVTSILNAWANGGKPNYGMFLQTGNYVPYMSEEMVSPEFQPVLVMDYTPTPEPMSLSLLALGGLGLLGRRMRNR